MPDDDYDTIVSTRARPASTLLVIEEYVMHTMRRQFVPLMTDPEFTRRERRLRMVYGAGGPANTGIAIFEIVR